MSRRAVSWSLVQQVGRQSINVAVYAAFAYLLPPGDLGLVAIGLAWTSFGAVFVDLGLSVALVQRPNMHDGHASSTFVLNLCLGAMMYVIAFVISTPVAAAYGLPSLEQIVRWLALSFILSSLGITQAAIAQRQMKFRELAIRDTVAVIGGGGCGVAMAILGFGVWSIVAQVVVTSALTAMLSWLLLTWRPVFGQVSFANIQELWGYSSRIVAVGILKYGMQNLDKIVLGLVVGAVGTGIYALAEKLILIPVGTFYAGIGAYLFSRLSSLQNDLSDAQDLFIKSQRLMSYLVFPALTAVAVVAPFLMPLVLKPEWAESILLVQFFSGVAAARALIAPVGEVMKAAGRADWFLWWAVFFSALTMVAIVLGARWGIYGVGLAVLLAHLIGVLVNGSIAAKIMKLSLTTYASTLIGPVVSAALVGSSVLGSLLVLPTSSIGSAIAAIAVGVITGVAFMRYRDPDILNLLFRRRGEDV